MSKWGFLKNVINIQTFFATSKNVKAAAKAGIKVDANGVKTTKQDKDSESATDDKKMDKEMEEEAKDDSSADKTDSKASDIFNNKKKAAVK